MSLNDQNPLLQAFTETGDFGTYQRGVFTLALLASLFSAPVYVDTYLLTYPMEHRCRIVECDNAESSYRTHYNNFTIPWDEDEGLSRCSQYTASSTGSGQSAGHGSKCAAAAFSSATEQCQDGWVYDTSLFTATAVKDFDLVCGRSGLGPLASSINMLGIMIGAILAGDLGDRWGRKFGLLVSVVFLVAGGGLAAGAPNYTTFLAARLLAGAGGGGVFLTTFVLSAECVGRRYRTYCGVIMMIPFALGEALTGVLAYYIRNWRYLQIAVTAPACIMITYLWLLPESVRWLVLQKRNTAALAVIKQAAKANKTILDDNLLVAQLADCEGAYADDVTSTKQKTVLDLLRLPRMRKRSLNLFFCWAVCTLVYYGLSSNSGRLAGNIFVNFIATMLIEVPSYIFTGLVLDRIGRKATLSSVMVIGGLASLICGLLPEDMDWLIVTLSLAGKFGISAAFAVVFVYSAEIFPTEYRGVGIGGCSMCARVGGILAPFVGGLGMYYPPLPMLVFGTLSITSGCLVALLPETMGCDLPQTLLDSEQFAMDQKPCYFSCFGSESREKETAKDEDKPVKERVKEVTLY